NGAGVNVIVTESISHFTSLALDPFAISAAIKFTDGINPSGLALGPITYSNNDGVTYAYTPINDGTGHDPNVTHFRVQMIGMIPANTADNPLFSLYYKAKIK
ncbi:MAG: hypothetical protein R8K46_08885, partial [Mariprofundaceae bacterium]